MSDPDWVLLSIQPYFVQKILSGEKTAELRRVRPRLASEGRRVLFYSSSPVMALTGGATIASVVEGPRERVWDRVGASSGVTRRQFDRYFAGARATVALVLEDVWHCQVPIGLASLRNRVPRFHPPQSYCYVTHAEVLRYFAAVSSEELATRRLRSGSDAGSAVPPT